MLRIEERPDGSLADLLLREPPLWPREPPVEQPREPRPGGGPPRAESNYLTAAARKQEEWHLR